MRPLMLIILLASFLFSCNREKTSSDKRPTKSQSSGDTTTIALEIDPVQAFPDKFRVLMENEHVRVVEYTLKPGETDGWHTHPPKSAYVVSGGKLKVFLENGETMVEDEIAGTSYWSDRIGKHYVENIGNTNVTIVITEIKSLE